MFKQIFMVFDWSHTASGQTRGPQSLLKNFLIKSSIGNRNLINSKLGRMYEHNMVFFKRADWMPIFYWSSL